MTRRRDHWISTVRQTTRFDDWWYSKLPPLLAVAYLQIASGGLPPGRTAALVGCLIATGAFAGACGHVINDSFDVAGDRRAGKRNSMTQLQPGWRLALCCALASAAFLPAQLVSCPGEGLGVLAASLLLPLAYSAPPIRLKERGALGLVCDAAGSHLLPTVFLLILIGSGSGGRSGAHWWFAPTAVAWATVLGLKGILHHQIIDRERDLRSGTATFATTRAEWRITRCLPWLHVCVEWPVSALLALAVVRTCPLAGVAFLAYSGVELLKNRLGFQFTLDGRPGTTRVSLPFANEAFYVWWLPLAAAIQLALLTPACLWVPLTQVIVFSRATRVHLLDLRDVVRACRLASARRLRRKGDVALPRST